MYSIPIYIAQIVEFLGTWYTIYCTIPNIYIFDITYAPNTCRLRYQMIGEYQFRYFKPHYKVYKMECASHEPNKSRNEMVIKKKIIAYLFYHLYEPWLPISIPLSIPLYFNIQGTERRLSRLPRDEPPNIPLDRWT